MKIQQDGLPLQIAVTLADRHELIKLPDPAGLSFLVLDAMPLDQLKDLSLLDSK